MKIKTIHLEVRNVGLIVTLDADVAEVFKTSEAVNNALRALLSAIPKTLSFVSNSFLEFANVLCVLSPHSVAIP